MEDTTEKNENEQTDITKHEGEKKQIATTPSRSRLSLFGGFDRLERMINNFHRRFNDLFWGGFDTDPGLVEDFRSPVTTMTTTEDAYIYHVEVPGLNREDLEIEVEDAFLTIKGEKDIEESDDDFYRHETSKYFRRVMLPPDAEYKNDIEAKLEDGLLNVKVNRKKKEKKKVDVQ